MGRKLNVELTKGDEVLCNCCFIDAATTDTALDITEGIINTYRDIFGNTGTDVYTAVKLFEAVGAGINGVERNRISLDISGRFDGIKFIPARTAYDGFISVTEEGIRETRRWENGRVRIDLAGKSFDFHVHYYTYFEDYIAFSERVPDCTPLEELPQINAQADIFTGIYFDRIQMVRKIVETYPIGFRLAGNDVIEWM